MVAITFASAVDDPARFRRSRSLGAHFGLTPKRYQSGETDVTGGISKAGDAMVEQMRAATGVPFVTGKVLTGSPQPTASGTTFVTVGIPGRFGRREKTPSPVRLIVE